MFQQPQSQVVDVPPQSRYVDGFEPSLNDMYEDPILLAVLRRDGLPLSTLKDIVRETQLRLVS